MNLRRSGLSLPFRGSWAGLALLLFLGLTACSTVAGSGSGSLLAAEPPGAAGLAWVDGGPDLYDVTLSADGGSLGVEALLQPGIRGPLVVADEMDQRIIAARVWNGTRWLPLRHGRGGFDASACARTPCRLAYGFDLSRGGEGYREIYGLYRTGTAAITPPSAWLLHSEEPEGRSRYQLAVHTPPGWSFVSGIPRVAPDTYLGWKVNLLGPPFSAFGQFVTAILTVGAQEVDLASTHAEVPGNAQLLRWATRAAEALRGYYGRFPVDRAQLIVVGGGDGSIGFGTTLGNGGASIVLWVGRGTKPSDLDDDWVLVHEMIHLSFPGMAEEHNWMTEGLATYLEPVIRARAGIESPEEAWRGLIDGLPQGLPERGDRGLDRTPTWGRIYWGGALFWLMTDLAIREETHDQRSLQDAMKGLVAAGGSFEVVWSVADTLAAMDAGTQTHAVSRMYARWSTEPVQVDLNRLWSQLGVRAEGSSGAAFDDSAPLAARRKGLMGR